MYTTDPYLHYSKMGERLAQAECFLKQELQEQEGIKVCRTMNNRTHKVFFVQINATEESIPRKREALDSIVKSFNRLYRTSMHMGYRKKQLTFPSKRRRFN